MRNLPILLIFHCNRARGRMHNRHRWRTRGGARDLLVLEFGSTGSTAISTILIILSLKAAADCLELRLYLINFNSRDCVGTLLNRIFTIFSTASLVSWIIAFCFSDSRSSLRSSLKFGMRKDRCWNKLLDYSSSMLRFI